MSIWACPCCGRHATSAFSKASTTPGLPHCLTCNLPYAQRRKYPTLKNCRHHRELEKMIKQAMVPRTVTRKKFRTTQEIRYAWNEVRAAKQIPAMIGKMNAFVSLVLDHARELPRCEQCGIYAAIPGDNLCEYCLGLRKRGDFHLYIVTHASRSTVHTPLHTARSDYRFGEAVGDYIISLDVTRVRDIYDDMARIRTDLIRILTDILDETASFPRNFDGKTRRLVILQKMFPETQLFRRSGPTRAEVRAKKLLEEAREQLSR